jgi:hypothetical protein
MIEALLMFLQYEFSSVPKEAAMRIFIVDLWLHGFEVLVFLIGAKLVAGIIECFFDGHFPILEYLQVSYYASIK